MYLIILFLPGAALHGQVSVSKLTYLLLAFRLMHYSIRNADVTFSRRDKKLAVIQAPVGRDTEDYVNQQRSLEAD